MPQHLSFSSWSSLHMSRTPRHPHQPHPPPAKSSRYQQPPSNASNSSVQPPPPAMQADVFAQVASGSPRASSMTGKKRPREGENDQKAARAARRTRSTGDAVARDVRAARESRDREAFQRQLIGVFVPRALKDSAEGNVANLNDLVAHFVPTATQPIVTLAPLLPLIRALSAHVSLVTPELHSQLVSAIVSLPWATGEDRFVKSYVGWAGVLVSAHPTWAKEVVGMAVKGLTWQSKFPNTSTITRRTFHARHHLLLSHLLSLIPTLPNVLQPLLNRYSPHKREPEVVQTTWVRNCTELIEYCPELGARVWSGLVDRMLRIDVEITNSVEEDDDDDDDDEDDDENDDENIAGPSPGTKTELDPFDLLISEDVPKTSQLEDDDDEDDDDDDDDEADPDPDALSSDDERDSDDEAAANDALKIALQKARKREALRSMRSKLDGMLTHFIRHLEETMGGREHGLSAAEMAAQHMASTGNSSGASTPTSETPTPTPHTSVMPSLNPTRPPPSPAQSLAHFQTLLNLFSRQILPTSATQHLPFLLFVCSSFSPAHTDLFLGLLVSQALYATTTNAPTLASQPVSLTQRVAATVYIGSLVCRARYVSDDHARTVMAYLLAYIDGKLAQARARQGRRGGNSLQLEELPLFYAVCQAVMLIFCFRWRALGSDSDIADGIVGELDLDAESVDDGPSPAPSGSVGGTGADGVSGNGGGGDGRWMRDLDILQRAITSELNPLLGCNPTIVSMFAKVAHQTNFAYCFSIIEANQQLAHTRSTSSYSLATTSATNTAATTAAPSRSSSTGAGQRTFARTSSLPTTSTASSVSTTSSLAVPRAARQSNIDAGLDSYFPFDPYDLPRSACYVNRLYRTWADVAVDLGGESDDDDDDDEEEDDTESISESDSSMLGRSRPSVTDGRSLPKLMSSGSKPGSYGDHRRRLLRDGGLSSSLENMSISPSLGFSTIGAS